MLRLTTLCLCLSLVVYSCASSAPKGFVKAELMDKIYTVPYFNDMEKDYVYKSSIDAFGNSFGGILILKKVDIVDYRVVMTTEFGNKLFDFQLSDSEFKVNFIIEPLDKKIIINTMRKDFQLLVKRNYLLKEKYINPPETRINAENGKYELIIKDDKLNTLVRMKSPRVSLYFVNSDGIDVDSMAIVHNNGRLTIGLKAFDL